MSYGDVTTFIDLFSRKHYFMHDKQSTNNITWILVSFLLCFTIQEVAKLPAAPSFLTLLVNWQKCSSPSQLMVKGGMLQQAGAAKSSRLHYINSILSVRPSFQYASNYVFFVYSTDTTTLYSLLYSSDDTMLVSPKGAAFSEGA